MLGGAAVIVAVDEFEVGAAVVKESSVSMASCGGRDGNVSQL